MNADNSPDRDQRDPQTYEIIGAAMDVHTELGCGFLEKVYHDALEIELRHRNVPFQREYSIPVRYKNQTLSTHYRAEFLCYDSIIVEFKALKQITSIEDAQVLHYLKATGLERALLLNFGTPRLTHQRFIRSKP